MLIKNLYVILAQNAYLIAFESLLGSIFHCFRNKITFIKTSL